MKRLVNKALNLFDLRLVNQTSYSRLVANEEISRMYKLFDAVDAEDFGVFKEACALSRSQLLQDVFALSQNSFKQGGFFVEFGSTDGVELSNSYLLEKHFGWTGILAEPAKCWHESLRQNRSAVIDTSCVWSKTGAILEFQEVEFGDGHDPSLSTLRQFVKSDRHKKSRGKSTSYAVETVSLEDLLIRHKAPRRIDYLSIDTEGSEFEILATFDFTAFEVGVISCEHNYTANRERIHRLLSANGFVRVLVEFSKFDDWYVRE